MVQAPSADPAAQAVVERERALAALTAQVKSQTALLEQQSTYAEADSHLRAELDRLSGENAALRAQLEQQQSSFDEHAVQVAVQGDQLEAQRAQVDAMQTQLREALATVAAQAEQMRRQRDAAAAQGALLETLTARLEGLEAERGEGSGVRASGAWQQARERAEAKLRKRQTVLQDAVMQVRVLAPTLMLSGARPHAVPQ